MGLISDFYAANATIPTAAPRVGIDRAVFSELEGQRQLVDPATTGNTAVNEVQSIAFNANIDGGTFKLKITLVDGTTYTTANITWSANAATIQTALDTASPATVANGAVVVSGGNLATANVVLTYSGTGTAGTNPAIAEFVDEALTDGGVGVDTPVITVTTAGQPTRTALPILFALGVFVGDAPVQGAVPTFTVGDRTYGKFPSPDTIRDLARQAAIEDNNDALYGYILDALDVAR